MEICRFNLAFSLVIKNIMLCANANIDVKSLKVYCFPEKQRIDSYKGNAPRHL